MNSASDSSPSSTQHSPALTTNLKPRQSLIDFHFFSFVLIILLALTEILMKALVMVNNDVALLWSAML